MEAPARSARLLRLAVLGLALLAPLAGQAQATAAATLAPDAATYQAARARWRAELDAFEAADSARMPAPGGVVFVGSSTIRFWSHLAQDFPAQPVIVNRGFGGSTMADCALLAQQLALRYKPRLVVIYAGDNDLAEGRTPLQVLESFAAFANALRAELPATRIAFISVKPSPSREKLLPQIRETNNIIAAYLRRLPDSDYIDVFTPMLGADGSLRPELFRPDMLHMNDEGYRLWQSIVGPRL